MNVKKGDIFTYTDSKNFVWKATVINTTDFFCTVIKTNPYTKETLQEKAMLENGYDVKIVEKYNMFSKSYIKTEEYVQNDKLFLYLKLWFGLKGDKESSNRPFQLVR